jgi:uncharacterized membrane protein
MASRPRRAAALAVAVALAALALAVVAGTPGLAGGVLVAAALLLVPGTAVTLALLPGNGTDNLVRSVTAIGMGFAIMVIGGVVLNQAGVPLTAPTWLLLLAVVTAVGGVLSLLERRRSLPVMTLEPAAVPAPRLDWHLRPVQVALLVAALLIAAGSVRVAHVGVTDQPVTGFTQLWILPASGTFALQVGILNGEGAAQTYRLELVRGTQALGSWPAVQLEQGATWTIGIPIPGGGSGPVQARLYRSTEPSVVYRSVTYWVSG